MKIKICSYLIIMFFLSGCATLKLVSLGISGISYLTTGKSLSDHAISAMTEQDCALHRMVFDEMVCRQTNHKLNSPYETKIAKIEVVSEPLTKTIQQKQTSLSSQLKSSYHPQHLASTNLTALNNSLKYFKVIGSFNNKSYANTRAELYKNLNAKVVFNTMDQTIKYRVIYGPVEKSTKLAKRNKKADTETQDDWLIALCSKNLQPPPCKDESQNAILAKIQY